MTARQPNQDFVFKLGERRLPAEWGDVIPTSVLCQEAWHLVERAQAEGLSLRIAGGLGIRLHAQRAEDLAQRLGRSIYNQDNSGKDQEFRDLDFIAYRRERKRLPPFFARLGYIKRRTTLATAMSERHIYFHPDGWFEVDIFFDHMLMEHTVELAPRLPLDYPTLSPTDLFLTKIQITHLSPKDLKDLWLLLGTHRLGKGEEETIDLPYVARRLARDWGFWYDALRNLELMSEFTTQSSLLKPEEKADIGAKLSLLRQRIQREPKSLGWKLRSLVGTRKQWYRPVEELAT